MSKDDKSVRGETYQAMQERHQQEVNAFPMKWAFTNQQFEQGMRELGLRPTQTSKIVGIGGGGFIRRSDKKAFIDMFKRQDAERKAALAAQKTGSEYAYQMFLHELGNHEYIVTGDLTDTLDACGLSGEDINNDPKLQISLARAIKDYMEAADQ